MIPEGKRLVYFAGMHRGQQSSNTVKRSVGSSRLAHTAAGRREGTAGLRYFLHHLGHHPAEDPAEVYIEGVDSRIAEMEVIHIAQVAEIVGHTDPAAGRTDPVVAGRTDPVVAGRTGQPVAVRIDRAAVARID